MKFINRIRFNLINWVLFKLIQKERKHQIEAYGYTLEHDVNALKADPDHLGDLSQWYYAHGKPIKALALLQAELEAIKEITRLSESK